VIAAARSVLLAALAAVVLVPAAAAAGEAVTGVVYVNRKEVQRFQAASARDCVQVARQGTVQAFPKLPGGMGLVVYVYCYGATGQVLAAETLLGGENKK